MKRFKYGRAEEQPPYHYTMCGLDDIYLLSGYRRDETKYGDGVIIDNIDGLHRAIGEYLVLFKKALAHKEVRFLRHQMDLTQAELGDIMRVGDQTVARWEKNETAIPGPAEMLLRALYLCQVSKRVDLRGLAEKLRQIDDSDGGMHLFAPTDSGWKSIAA